MTAQPRMSTSEGQLVFLLTTALSAILNILDPVTDEDGKADGAFVEWSVDHAFEKVPQEIASVAVEGHKGTKYAWQQSMRREQ